MKKVFILIIAFCLYSNYGIALSVGTYNTWHGLNGQGKISIGELEAAHERKSREEDQDEYLKNLITDKLDITFLQEVNPVYKRSEKWSASTGKDSVAGVDNCGLKLMGLGIPTNLYSGLTIVANKEYQLKKIATHALSGGGFVISSHFCAHFSERRAALFATVVIPGYGKTLLVNTHLHHRHGISLHYKTFLDQKLTDGQIDSQEHRLLTQRAENATERRKNELTQLIGYVKKYKKEFSVENVIVAGDFNMDIHRDGKNLQRFEKETDLVFPLDSVGLNYYSWWPEENSNKDYIFDFIADELENDSDITEDMRTVLLEEEGKPRLIDLMYFSEGFLKDSPPLFSPIGFEKSPDDRHLSDHFGYTLEFPL